MTETTLLTLLSAFFFARIKTQKQCVKLGVYSIE